MESRQYKILIPYKKDTEYLSSCAKLSTDVVFLSCPAEDRPFATLYILLMHDIECFAMWQAPCYMAALYLYYCRI